ncbi:MAG: hypothetical protein VKO64_09125 [Candidatus Sericytochromatia bacterium]|nr:hypothetical protein [Candidatus Sericytochromatia bacterium]
MPVNLVERQANIRARIGAGINKGQLTGSEAAELGKSLKDEHREIVRDRIDGPGMTAPERFRSQLDLLELGGQVRDLRRN